MAAARQALTTIRGIYLTGATVAAVHLAARGAGALLSDWDEHEYTPAGPSEEGECRCETCERARANARPPAWPTRIRDGGDVVLAVGLWPVYLGAVTADYVSRVVQRAD